MFLIRCPFCGERDISEFAHGGEAHIARPRGAEELRDAEWAGFVFMRANPKGVIAERWNHQAGCRRWFNMLRNTATDDILAVYKVGEPRPEVSARPAADAERRGLDRLGQRRGEGDAAGRSGQGRRMSRQPYRLPRAA